MAITSYISYLIFIISYLLTPITCSICPTNFLHLHNKCYYFSVNKESWRDAHFICKDLNSHLATIGSKNIDNSLQNYTWSGYLAPHEWWIGASYDWKKKLWRWGTSGRIVKYQNMFNNNKLLEWHCAFLDRRLHYKWNSALCTKRKNFICQKKVDGNVTDTAINEIPLIASPFARDSNRNLTTNLDANQPGFINKPSIKQGTTSRTKYICPNGYRHVKGSCYKFSKTRATWQDAYYNCDAEFNGTLAIIPDKSHDKALRRAIKRLGIENYDRWIGGIYDWKEMAWKWATNGVIIQHQTVDKDLLKWHCLVWSPLITDKWTSDNCVKEKYFVCQTKGTRIMFPATMRAGRPNTKSRKQKWNYDIEMNLQHQESGYYY